MARRKQRRGGHGREVATAVAVVAAVGGAVALGAARRRSASGARSGASGDAGEHGATQTESYTCTCGTEFRVAGAGRHQVLWLADAPEDDPVLGDRCPSCDAPLPGAEGSPATTA